MKCFAQAAGEASEVAEAGEAGEAGLGGSGGESEEHDLRPILWAVFATVRTVPMSHRASMNLCHAHVLGALVRLCMCVCVCVCMYAHDHLLWPTCKRAVTPRRAVSPRLNIPWSAFAVTTHLSRTAPHCVALAEVHQPKQNTPPCGNKQAVRVTSCNPRCTLPYRFSSAWFLV